MILKIISNRSEIGNKFSLILEKPTNWQFYPGQYLDIELSVNDPNGNTRAFTMSSSPTEEFLMISTRSGISPFKQALAKLQKGDLLNSSHPVGTFTLDESSPAVFLAGGIGITPFRSMIKYAVDMQLTTPITLIHLNSDDNFLFKPELDHWQKQLKNFNIHYINSKKTGRLNSCLLKKLCPLRPRSEASIFYLAGPPGMVADFEKTLLSLGIDQTNIRYDNFDGY